MHVPQIFNVIIVKCWQQTKDAIPNNHSTVGMWRIRNLWFKPVDTGIPETKSHSSGICTILTTRVPSVLWRCWLGIQPVKKTEWWGAGIVICLERSADCIWPSWCHCVCYNSSLLHHTDNNVFVGTAQRQRRCHAARTMTSLSARRDDDDDVATTWGDVVSSCRVYCNQTNWKQRRHSQYARMASWLCMCTVNGVVAFNELDYSGQANLQCT